MSYNTDEIEIDSYEKCLDDLLPKYLSTNENQAFSITNIRAIVIHGSEKASDIENDMIPYLIESKQNPYHFIIDKDGRIAQINSVNKALKHCRSNKYTSFANKFFGDTICPIYEDTTETPHPEASPDNSTISICVPEYNTNVFNALVKLCSYIINRYAKYLEGPTGIISAFEISDNFSDPTWLKDRPEIFLKLKYDVEKKRSHWFVLYNGYKLGYPEPKIAEMKIEE